MTYSFSFSHPSQSNQLQKCFSNLFSSLIHCSSTQKGLKSLHKVLNLFTGNSECFTCHTNLFALLIHSLFFNCARSTSKCKFLIYCLSNSLKRLIFTLWEAQIRKINLHSIPVTIPSTHLSYHCTALTISISSQEDLSLTITMSATNCKFFGDLHKSTSLFQDTVHHWYSYLSTLTDPKYWNFFLI